VNAIDLSYGVFSDILCPIWQTVSSF